MDPRIVKQAEILVNTSVKIKRGDRVMVIADIEAKPLVLELYGQILLKGASEVRVHFDSYEFGEIYFKNASNSQIMHFPSIAMKEIKDIDAYIAIRCPSNTRGLSGIDAGKVSRRQKVIAPISKWRVQKTRWVVTTFPTESQAQEADMSLGEFEDFVFSSMELDWKKVKASQEKLRKLVDGTKTVRIVGEDTDLTLKIEGRKAVSAWGECNMPDGEVFTSVVENSANGKIRFSYPALYFGREFDDVRLTFKRGVVIEAKAAKKERDLNAILDMDKGARMIGELGIGNNFKLTRFVKHILFDEKMGGTIHIALGKGYKETLSKNTSALHWDMIKDLRDSGELWFDGKLVQKKGRWLV